MKQDGRLGYLGFLQFLRRTLERNPGDIQTHFVGYHFIEPPDLGVAVIKILAHPHIL